jgi:hypothetical protein
MNVYIVHEERMYCNVFTTKKQAVQHLYRYGYHFVANIGTCEAWDKPCDPGSVGCFMAYLECKPLIGANHNYKYECKQLRATVRYLHEKIRRLQHKEG